MIIEKYECSHKDNVRDFAVMVDSLLDKYPDYKSDILHLIGIKESKLNKAVFNNKQFRNVIHLYSKEISNHKEL